MKFGKLQRAYFKAQDGAYSIVTDNERKKGQVTLVEKEGEVDVALSALGRANIPREAAKAKPVGVYVRSTTGLEKSEKLTINFPKAGKDELRIYRNAARGFNYEAGDVWYVFRRGRRLYVGCMAEVLWRSIGRIDPDDETYLSDATGASATAPPAKKKAGTVYKYPRDPKLASERIRFSKYKCEVDPHINLFTSRATGMPYLEAHHLIPMFLQKEFSASLDNLENICAISPHHHRRIHLGTVDEASEVIEKLWQRRNRLNDLYGVTYKDILRFYNCENIK